MIKYLNVIKKYGNTLAVDNLNLVINKGEIFGLLGPNGAGKSTSNKMLIGLLKPTSGKILVNGLNVVEEGLKTRDLMAIVPQELAIYESMTAYDNVKFFAKLANTPKSKLRDSVNEALEFCGLKESKKLVKTFSGGMKRRLNIACAIVNNPEILILDEPTVGIDPQSRSHILNSIKELNKRGMTIVYTSHYMSEVEQICTRVGIIDNGKLIAIGTKEDLKSQLKDQEKIIIEVSEINFTAKSAIEELYGVKQVILNGYSFEIDTISSQASVVDILSIMTRYKLDVQKITIVKPSLEDVYLSITGKKLRD